MPTRTASPPPQRPSRVVVEPVRPIVSVADGVELCLHGNERDADDDERIELTEVDGHIWHAYLPDVRRASATATGCTDRGSPPGGCGATRRSCSSTPTPRRSRADRLGPRVLRVRFDDPMAAQSRRQRTARVEGRGRRPLLRLGQRPSPQRAPARDRDLRSARQGHDDDPPRRPRGAAGNLRGHRPSRDHRASPRARDHGRRADAGTRVRPGPSPGRERACGTTGGTTRSRSSRHTTSTRRRSPWARSRSSRRWSSLCMRRASR